MSGERVLLPEAFFVTATGTEVGKTYVSGLLVKALREKGIDAGYYKPVLSDAQIENGMLVPGDADYVCKVAHLDVDPCDLVSHLYTTPVAPHLAARQEGAPGVSLDTIRADFEALKGTHERLVVEGCGGVVCPLSVDPDIMLLDVIKMLDLPILIVSGSGLGSINAAVLTVEYARMHALDILGIIMNRYDEGNILHRDNAAHIEALTRVPILARVKEGASSLASLVS